MTEDFEGSRAEFMKMLAEHDGPPAYLLRAQRVEEAWANIIRNCEREKDSMLDMCRTRLAQLGAIIDHRWDSVRCLVKNDCYDQYLEDLFQQWQPTLRVPLQPSTSLRQHRTAVSEMAASFARFNRRWTAYVSEVSLDHVNYERSEYNNYYLVEKSAALGSDKLAEMGFERLNMCTHDDLFEAVPLLTEPDTI